MPVGDRRGLVSGVSGERVEGSVEKSYRDMNDAPKGTGAVVGEDGADLVLRGEISGPCVDLCALDVVRGCVRGEGCSGNAFDAG